MKKLIFSVAAIAIVFASCSDDDDNGTTNTGVTTAAVLEGGPYSFLAGDGEADIVDITIADAGNGTNNTFVITDEELNILGAPPTLNDIPDFDDQGVGVCLIWHLNYEDDVTGIEVGANAADLEGDFKLSESVKVTRNGVTAALLEGGPYTFCVDGIEDNITDVVVSDAGYGQNGGQVVVTDTDGLILGLPGAFAGPDFDEAGVGECYVYHLNYIGEVSGLAAGGNINELEGDFELSNFLTVNREDCAPAVTAATLVAGASATEGVYSFVVDGTADNVTDLIVENAGVGETGQIVVTDEEGWILGLPGAFAGPDFDEAGVGVCYIRHINYDGALEGLAEPVDGVPTANINDLEGSFKISNIIVVNRVAAQ